MGTLVVTLSWACVRAALGVCSCLLVWWDGLGRVSPLRDASQLWRAAPEIVDVMNAGEAKAFPKGWSFENYGWKLD